MLNQQVPRSLEHLTQVSQLFIHPTVNPVNPVNHHYYHPTQYIVYNSTKQKVFIATEVVNTDASPICSTLLHPTWKIENNVGEEVFFLNVRHAMDGHYLIVKLY